MPRKYRTQCVYYYIRFLIALLSPENNIKYAPLLFKLIQKIIQVLQEQWFSTLDQIMGMVIQLSSEKELLLQKFKYNLFDVKTVLADNSLTNENLNRHKIIVEAAIGKSNLEESKRINIETQKDLLEKEVQFWVTDWKTIRKSAVLIVVC